ncbi:DUF4232 domain-containing protein [Amycolatopsis sp. OK19-0408]|uniref:DUF4232 domain-containing protein n=1 Tax=Amycolatopsis iheyensis TaxID=2945988 RepID=A0A9X2N5A2_9PSEU|nr:DUF4232 domain-containing protein [Amycolatopsis iheyensis]MCR6481557.1 DUF4232 domain-containing protein [Amycolatopsis iheyensis]
MKRTATALIVGGLTAGGLFLATGAANAMPSDTPCGASDVNVSVTPDPSGAAGHEAFVLTYTAASPTTNCKLEGAPTAVSFLAGGQQLPVTTSPDNSESVPVNLRAGHPAESRVIQRSAAAPSATPEFVTFDLPTGPFGQPVSVAWPAGEPLKGDNVQVTPVS